MAYQSLYRKYRPQTFADVIGQGHVTRTLQNALESGRVAHGYLFTGTRGTAKTTVARLLAKSLNCESTGRPVREPCNVCAACRSITAGGAVDVIEMDAASHRGVADIEEVRRSVGFGPMELRYKVFIIDEAHQLSSDAKDAFLKTLEEPPDNVVFILATTEPQSIPITIRSRCQQFDFKRGSLVDISTGVRNVLDQEGVTYAPAAVSLVARAAEGSYRDSLSLLEQVLAFSPGAISAADVEMVLGELDSVQLARVVEAAATRDAATLLGLAGELLDSGKEARTLLRALSLHFRDLLLVTVGGPAVGHELTPEEIGQLKLEARFFTAPRMVRAMEILGEAQGETRWNNQHRLLVELTFLKLAGLADTAAETPAASSFPTIPAPLTPARRPADPAPERSAPSVPAVSPAAAIIRETPASLPVPSAAVSPAAVPPAAVPPAAVPPAILSTTARPAEEPEEEDSSAESSYFTADTDDEDDFVPEDPSGSLFESEETPLATIPDTLAAPLPETLAGEPDPVDDGPGLFVDDPAVEPVAIAAVASAPERESAPAVSEFSLDQVLRCWPEFLRRAGSVSKKTEMMMLGSRPTDVRSGVLDISFRERSNFDIMSQPKSHEFVRELMKRCLGTKHLTVHFRLDEGAAPPPPRAAANRSKAERDPMRDLDKFGPSIEAGNGAPGDYDRDDGYYGSDPGSGPSYQAEPVHERPSGYGAPDATPTAPPTAPASSRPDSSLAEPRQAYASPSPAPPPPESGGMNAVAAANADARRAAAGDHPLVQEALSVFGGDIVVEE